MQTNARDGCFYAKASGPVKPDSANYRPLKRFSWEQNFPSAITKDLPTLFLQSSEMHICSAACDVFQRSLVFFEDLAVLHDKGHRLERVNVVERIGHGRDDVRF